MTYDIKKLTEDMCSRLSEYRRNHSFGVAECARELAQHYGGDCEKAYLAGLVHDILKEQSREDALSFFEENGVVLTKTELAAPKLWHAIAGAVYLKNTYALEEDIISAVRYHTTGREGMSLLEKILFTADFISADREYEGVEEMRQRAKISLELAMEEGFRFTVFELSGKCLPIHPDTVAGYNEIILSKEK